MEVEAALAFVDELVFAKTQERMTDLERAVFRGAWQGKSYKQIHRDCADRCGVDHLMRNVAPDLWKLLSEVLGVEVTKNKLQGPVERVWQQSCTEELPSPDKSGVYANSADAVIEKEDAERGRPIKHLPISSLEYFCYISESKVNQLYSQISNDTDDIDISSQDTRRIVEIRKELALAKNNPSSHLSTLEEELKLIESRRNLISIGFGRRAEARAKQEIAGFESLETLLPKFRAVICNILQTKRVLDLANTIANQDLLNGFCYYYLDKFRFEEFASPEMVIIGSRCRDYNIRLYCSMKYFSDMAYSRDDSGKWQAHPHSANWAFFDKKVNPEYSLKSIIFLTSVNEKCLLGSPLCLILNSTEDIAL
jgi:hypothetical protein